MAIGGYVILNPDERTIYPFQDCTIKELRQDYGAEGGKGVILITKENYIYSAYDDVYLSKDHGHTFQCLHVPSHADAAGPGFRMFEDSFGHIGLSQGNYLMFSIDGIHFAQRIISDMLPTYIVGFAQTKDGRIWMLDRYSAFYMSDDAGITFHVYRNVGIKLYATNFYLDKKGVMWASSSNAIYKSDPDYKGFTAVLGGNAPLENCFFAESNGTLFFDSTRALGWTKDEGHTFGTIAYLYMYNVLYCYIDAHGTIGIGASYTRDYVEHNFFGDYSGLYFKYELQSHVFSQPYIISNKSETSSKFATPPVTFIVDEPGDSHRVLIFDFGDDSRGAILEAIYS